MQVTLNCEREKIHRVPREESQPKKEEQQQADSQIRTVPRSKMVDGKRQKREHNRHPALRFGQHESKSRYNSTPNKFAFVQSSKHANFPAHAALFIQESKYLCVGFDLNSRVKILFPQCGRNFKIKSKTKS